MDNRLDLSDVFIGFIGTFLRKLPHEVKIKGYHHTLSNITQPVEINRLFSATSILSVLNSRQLMRHFERGF